MILRTTDPSARRTCSIMGIPATVRNALSTPMRLFSPPARMIPVMIKITVFTMRCQQRTYSHFSIFDTLMRQSNYERGTHWRIRFVASAAEVLKFELYVDKILQKYLYSVHEMAIYHRATGDCPQYHCAACADDMVASGGLAEIGTLDVCHSATPALSSNGDMPCINECLHLPLPQGLIKISAVAVLRLKPFSIAFQDERPPKS